MKTTNSLHRFAGLVLIILCSACTSSYRPITFHSGERQPMKITMGVVGQVSDAEIPIATWKDGAQNGQNFGQVFGESVSSLGGASVPLGIAIILLSKAAGNAVGALSDNTVNTIKGQEVEIIADMGGEPLRLFQPSHSKKLKLGDRVRIVEGSFFSRLEPANE